MAVDCSEFFILLAIEGVVTKRVLALQAEGLGEWKSFKSKLLSYL